MATATKTKSFDVTCPHCHDTDSTVTLDLNDLNECRCSGCDETFSAKEAVAMLTKELAKWEKVARFVEMAKEMLAE